MGPMVSGLLQAVRKNLINEIVPIHMVSSGRALTVLTVGVASQDGSVSLCDASSLQCTS